MKSKIVFTLTPKHKNLFLLVLYAGIFCVTTKAQIRTYSLPAEWLSICASTTNHFNVTGVNTSFTQQIHGRMGIVGEAAIYFGKKEINGLDKFQFMGGFARMPSGNAGKVSIFPYVLMGATETSFSYRSELTSFSRNQFEFSAALGARVDLLINDRLSFVVKSDYNPSLSSGRIESRFRLEFGFRVAFTEIKLSESTIEPIDYRSGEEHLRSKRR